MRKKYSVGNQKHPERKAKTSKQTKQTSKQATNKQTNKQNNKNENKTKIQKSGGVVVGGVGGCEDGLERKNEK